MSWFWVVHLFWNKTPASSWSYQKQGLAPRERSLQELELSLAYVEYNNKCGKISMSQPTGPVFRTDSDPKRMARMYITGSKPTQLKGNQTQENHDCLESH